MIRKPRTTSVFAESGIKPYANFSHVGNHPVFIHTTMVVRQHDRFYAHRDCTHQYNESNICFTSHSFEMQHIVYTGTS
ncbi:hypothetical protein SeMB42_g00971 [Synchytrium endobioticum]|uniref:Uncharacterized protein n=1 Tax=Synchytrium endobioticum TaxID=286115 RepID=A0A507D170_9FUNG|nr:hypothetical protein SeLEV6574_g04118 [Synchytrium endobioticum]TPX53113.1 hypothetical protein SeMB42_g00971 [Synchytrium endobioticum]